jgi:amino acid transporter
MRIGLGKMGFAAQIVPLAIVAFLGIRIAQSSVQFAGNTRLPMVAGWDRLLPEWFTRLHAKRKTPVNSILFVGAMTLAMGLVGLIGVGEQEAFQLLWNASGIFYALTYLVMFAIPLAGLKGTAERAPLWLKLASASGLLMTLLYVTLSISPVIKVESRFAFAAKIAAVIVAANLVGAVLFLVAERRRSRETVASANAVVD